MKTNSFIYLMALFIAISLFSSCEQNDLDNALVEKIEHTQNEHLSEDIIVSGDGYRGVSGRVIFRLGENRTTYGSLGTSPNDTYRLVFDSNDGRLKIIVDALNYVVYTSPRGTGQKATKIEFQASDGNFVLYRYSSPVWAAGVTGQADRVALLDDGRLVIVNSSNNIRRTIATPFPINNGGTIALRVGQSAGRNTDWRSPNGRYRLVFQGDGNLVLYDTVNGGAPWATGTHNQGGVTLRLRNDRDLVITRSNGQRVYESRTRNQNNIHSLRVFDNGAVTLANSDGNTVKSLR